MTQPTAKPPETPKQSEAPQPPQAQPPTPKAPSASVSDKPKPAVVYVKPDIPKLAESVVLRMCSAADETLSDEELRKLSQAIWNLQKEPPAPPWSADEEIRYVSRRMTENDVVIVYDVRVVSGKGKTEVAKNSGSIMLKNLLLPNMVVNSVASFKEQCNGGIIQPVHSEFQAFLETQLERKSAPPERGMLLPEKTKPEETPDTVPGDLA